jgi:hypothetical protein
MRYYQPVRYDDADRLVGPILLGCGVVPTGTPVLKSKEIAVKMMEHLGACYVFELSDDYIDMGANTEWGHDSGWRTLKKDAPICEVLHTDLDQMLVDRAEILMLGLPLPADKDLAGLANVCRRPLASFKPDPDGLCDFRILYGRAPTIYELREMSSLK